MAQKRRRGGPEPRFSRRVAFMEQPEVVALMEELAVENGRSLASEIRVALRYWLKAGQEE